MQRPAATMTSYKQQLETLYRQHHLALQRRLHKGFPRADQGLVEDAVASAFEDALVRPDPFVAAWQRGGDARLLILFNQVAWRHLRGHYRKKSSQCELPALHAVSEPGDRITPYDFAAGREVAALVRDLIDEAARQFGGSHERALRQALHARLEGGSDTEVARRHHVPREYLNRAKRWIGARLRDHHSTGRPLLDH